MKTKICSKCKIEKNFTDFYPRGNGLRCWCIDCTKIYRNSTVIIEYTKQYKKEYRQKYPEKVKLQNYNYVQSHKLERQKYRELNKEKIKKYMKLYRKLHQENHKEAYNKYKRNRFKTDLNIRILSYLKNRLYRALKGNTKLSTTRKLIGCSMAKLKQHLESQFKPGMSWKNYCFYGWHIDHIRPCASFNLSKKSEQRKCFHYTNLQPLWATDNWEKGKKFQADKD